MLGLGVGFYKLAGNDYISGLVEPSKISNLHLWLKANKGIIGEDGGDSDAGTMSDGEDITSWADQSGRGRHALGDGTDSKKPHWETDAADFGGLKWPDDTADTHMDLTPEKEIKILANTDFTIMMRVKLSDFTTAMALLGSAAQDIVKWTTNKRVAILIAGAGATVFEESSDTIATDKYYIHTLTRTDGSTGNITYHVHGDSYNDKFWNDDSSTRRDSDEFDITNIGCGADGVLPVEGVIKDVLIWNGTALSDAQRSDMYAYILGQQY